MRDKRVKLIVEIALVVALAAILNALKIWRMPQGGTVSFVMLPIIVLAIRRGVFVGLATGVLYGVVDFFVDPFPPVHWIQPLLDYPVAYGAVGLAGLMSAPWRRAVESASLRVAGLSLLIAAATAGLARYAVHTVSGAIFFAEYAPEGQPAMVYSMIYNLYVPVSAGLALAAAVIVLPALERAVPSVAARGESTA
jgi:thiamine transporter